MPPVYSLLRKMEYEALNKVRMDGKILDLGGSSRSGYQVLIKGDHTIQIANLNPGLGTDFVFDLEEKFPFSDAQFDGIICLNVMEHIFDFKNLVSESYRILKPGGKFAGSVPYLFPIHGYPDYGDYFRYSRAALEKIFKQAGFSEIEIKELGGGLFSVIGQLKWGLFHYNWLRRVAIKFYYSLDRILIANLLNRLRPGNRINNKYLPLGYSFVLKK